jgi:hypothetical protein
VNIGAVVGHTLAGVLLPPELQAVMKQATDKFKISKFRIYILQEISYNCLIVSYCYTNL